jgi:PAS domain-containing protein
MYGGLTCKLLSRGPSSWFFDIQRGRNQAAFDDAEAALLTQLVPHFSRAAEISQHFKASRALSLAASNLPFGIIVVNAQLRILSTNAFADALLSRTDQVFVARSGVLAVRDRGHAERFAALVAGACGALGLLGKERAGGDLLLGHGDGSRFAVSVAPLAEPEHTRMFWDRARPLSSAISNPASARL